MSVEYSTGIYKGYPITDEEYEKIEEMFPDFGDTYNDVVHVINAWTGEGGYFFGYCIANHDDESSLPTKISSLEENTGKNDRLNLLTSMANQAGLFPPEPELYLLTLVY